MKIEGGNEKERKAGMKNNMKEEKEIKKKEAFDFLRGIGEAQEKRACDFKQCVVVP